jgi:hypothetical protein
VIFATRATRLLPIAFLKLSFGLIEASHIPSFDSRMSRSIAILISPALHIPLIDVLSIAIGPISFVKKTAYHRVRAIYRHSMTGPLFENLLNSEFFGYLSDFMLTSLAIVQCRTLRPIDLG